MKTYPVALPMQGKGNAGDWVSSQISTYFHFTSEDEVHYINWIASSR